MTTQLRSAHENQFGSSSYVINGQSNNWAYYVTYKGTDPSADSDDRWVLSLADESGYVRTGSRLRFINRRSGQYLTTGSYQGTQFLKTVGDHTPECDWVLEPA